MNMNKAVVNGGFLIGVRFIGIVESLPVDRFMLSFGLYRHATEP